MAHKHKMPMSKEEMANMPHYDEMGEVEKPKPKKKTKGRKKGK